MLEVGKKYKSSYSGAIAKCLWSDGEDAVIEHYNGTRVLIRVDLANWTEYKEPVTITRYAYVIKNELGVVMFDNGLYGNENEARRDFDFSYGEYGYTILAIIPVTYTDENGA